MVNGQETPEAPDKKTRPQRTRQEHEELTRVPTPRTLSDAIRQRLYEHPEILHLGFIQDAADFVDAVLDRYPPDEEPADQHERDALYMLARYLTNPLVYDIFDDHDRRREFIRSITDKVRDAKLPPEEEDTAMAEALEDTDILEATRFSSKILGDALTYAELLLLFVTVTDEDNPFGTRNVAEILEETGDDFITVISKEIAYLREVLLVPLAKGGELRDDQRDEFYPEYQERENDLPFKLGIVMRVDWVVMHVLAQVLGRPDLRPSAEPPTEIHIQRALPPRFRTKSTQELEPAA